MNKKTSVVTELADLKPEESVAETVFVGSSGDDTAREEERGEERREHL